VIAYAASTARLRPSHFGARLEVFFRR